MVSVFVNQYKDPFSGNAPLDSVSFWGIRPSYFSKFFPVLSILESSGKVISSWKLRKSEVAQSCLTLCDPMDCSLPGSSVHGIFQARVLEWIAISFSSGSSRPRDRTQVPCIVDRRFTIWATKEVHLIIAPIKLTWVMGGRKNVVTQLRRLPLFLDNFRRLSQVNTCFL